MCRHVLDIKKQKIKIDLPWGVTVFVDKQIPDCKQTPESAVFETSSTDAINGLPVECRQQMNNNNIR